MDKDLIMQEHLDRISGLADGLTMISFGIDYVKSCDADISPGIRAVADEIKHEVAELMKFVNA